VLRILTVNFAAIHTSTMVRFAGSTQAPRLIYSFPQALTHSLYDLVTHPEYVDDMRKEAEAIIEEDGWTKAAMQRMRKIDSFLKESQRLNSAGSSEFDLRSISAGYSELKCLT
jgi:hypothetical protein